MKSINKLRPVGSQPGVLYALVKVHKKVIDSCLVFQPILSAIETPTYKIAKFLVLMLKDLTSRKYSVKDSFDFAKEILQQNSDCFMASLDITSLFTNIPLDETINIYSNESLIKSNMFKILIEPVLRNFYGLLRKSHFLFSIKLFINN